MTKNYISCLVCFILCTVCFTACYKDKGNYNYASLDQIVIDTTGIPATRTITRFDTLSIRPVVRYKGAVVDAAKPQFPELAFSWVIYPAIIERLNDEHFLDSTVYLNVPLKQPEMNWNVLFTVTNKNTGVKAFATFAISITTALAEGWMVMYEKTGNTDLALIVNDKISKNAAKDRVLYDLYEAANGAPLKGKPGSLIYSVANLPNFSLYLQTDQDAVSVNTNSIVAYRRFSDSLFWTPPSVKTPVLVKATEARRDLLINNNRLHMINYTTIASGPRKFDVGAAGTYGTLAPWTAATVASVFGAVVYDQTNMRFLKITSTGADLIPFSTVQASTAAFDVNNVGMKFLMADLGWNYYEHMIMKDEAAGKYYLLTANFKGGEITTIGKGKYDISAMPEVANINSVTAGFLGEVFYYSAGSDKVYQLKYNAGTTNIAWTAPANEKVTCIQLQKYYNTNVGLARLYDPKNANKIIYIATWNDAIQSGKVYELEVDPSSGVINTATQRVYQGFGKIKAMAWKPYI